MKQKWIALSLSVLLTGSVFSGCAGTHNTQTDLPASTPSTEQPQETPQISTDPNLSEVEKPTQSPTENPTKQPTVSTSQQPATQQPANTPAPAITLSSLMNSMIGALPADSYALSQIPEEFIGNVYQIDTSKYEDVLVYGSMMGVHANEIILIKAKDTAGVSEGKNILQNRKSQLIEQWKSYLPDQYELVKQSKIVSSGLYIAFVCANNQDQAVNAFQKALK